jgi:hypothetical protein
LGNDVNYFLQAVFCRIAYLKRASRREAAVVDRKDFRIK